MLYVFFIFNLTSVKIESASASANRWPSPFKTLSHIPFNFQALAPHRANIYTFKNGRSMCRDSRSAPSPP